MTVGVLVCCYVRWGASVASTLGTSPPPRAEELLFLREHGEDGQRAMMVTAFTNHRVHLDLAGRVGVAYLRNVLLLAYQDTLPTLLEQLSAASVTLNGF